MSWVVHPEHFLATATSAELPTTPERPDTIDAQMQQLAAGDRRVVMVPVGTKMPGGISKHLHVLRVPKAGNFIYDHTAIGPREIRRAAKFNRLPEVLGATEGGMGAPDKTELESPVAAVVGKASNGTVTQGTVTDQANLPTALKQTELLTPLDGKVEIASPEEVIAERNAWRMNPQDFLQQVAS